MRDGDNPKSVRLFQINNSEGKAFRFPTAGSESARLAEFWIALQFGHRCLHSGEKSLSKSCIPMLVEFRRLDQLTCGESMISDGLHSMLGGPLSSPGRREFLSRRRIRFP